jgi:hypothetical protein
MLIDVEAKIEKIGQAEMFSWDEIEELRKFLRQVGRERDRAVELCVKGYCEEFMDSQTDINPAKIKAREWVLSELSKEGKP